VPMVRGAMSTVAPRKRDPLAPVPGARGTAALGARFPWKPVLGGFALITAMLTVIVALASRGEVRAIPYLQGPAWLDGWFQLDGGWYYDIAVHGYFYQPGQQSSIAFFPTYPLAVRALGKVLGDYQIAGSVIGVASGAGAVLLFGAWVWRRLPRAGAVTAIAVLMLYPYAFFLYGAMYADSLFLLTTLGAFLLLERRMYWLAGLVGALATAGRPVGIAVTVGLVVRMLELRAQDRAAERLRNGPLTDVVADRPGWRDLVSAFLTVRWREVGVLLSGAGLLAWIVFLWLRFGDPLAFIAVESAPGWNQGVGPKTWFKLGYLGSVIKGQHIAILLTVQALACLAAVLLIRRVWRRFGWGYTAYAAVVIAIPVLGTKDFMGAGRYVLVAFPVMAAAGDFLATTKLRWVRSIVLTTCVVLMIGMTILYGQGVEVS
jgi:hypothetical protein